MTPELFDTLAAHLDSLTPQLVIGFGVFLRVGAMMALMPAFGETVVPVRVRLALAIAFTLIITPAVGTDLAQLRGGPGPLVTVIAAEGLAGLVLGVGLRLFVIALQTAGTIAAQATSLSQFFGGAGVDPQPAMSRILVMAGLALAVINGLHVRLAEFLILSYSFFPAGGFPDAGNLGEWGTAQISRAFMLAFTLAMPFVMMSVLYYVALGAINKAMPQLMVAFVGAPAITFAGLALLFLTAPLLLPIWQDAFHGFIANPTGPPR
ncbi:flagellar biosynthetic protein FliR [Roseinatronobacter alkalisoli]|uniref:Flagellar biosynthetic protein FliR n=1 Tax=Roseinatronobacter alkalisoli TaxID=3028235 RepID=A0ABT5T4X1_9RHOB|nr:flagellar biosynthetic protein FliR [Roseinatronobacter sp. HJB301]MDD7970163.1 flagellar biosynthetic protein FliR [Roseinatronobacter sp. HJB301]